MADFALTATQIGVVFEDRAIKFHMTAAATITKGQVLFVDTNGKVDLADANAAGKQQTRLLALEGGGAGQSIPCLKEGHVFGFTITQAYDSEAFQSDTAGALADAAGTLSVPTGIISGVDQGGTITKVMYFAPRWGIDYA